MSLFKKDETKTIFCIFGPSGSGKDSITKDVLKALPELAFIIPLTTRPKRTGEEYGKDYFFITKEKMEAMIEKNQLMEHRKYDVIVDGEKDVWYYGTEIPSGQNSLIIGTPEVINSLQKFCEEKHYRLFSIYLLVEEEELLLRMIQREAKNETPNWEELVRRFYADQKDFNGIGTAWNSCLVSHIVRNRNGQYNRSVASVVDFISKNI